MQCGLERSSGLFRDPSGFLNGVNGRALDDVEGFHFIVGDACERGTMSLGIVTCNCVS